MKKTILINGTGNANWIGGLYYKKNILFSMLQNENIVNRYNIVVITTEENKLIFNVFSPAVKIVIIKKSKFKWLKKIQQIMILLTNHVDYIYPFSRNKVLNILQIKTISWIADFQHQAFPKFFSQNEIDTRNKRYNKIAIGTEPLVLSSYDAKEDFYKYYGQRGNVYVVPFVSYIEAEINSLTPDFEKTILDKYQLINVCYICISNQFWQHKNHIVVAKAIQYLNNKIPNFEFQFIFTGALKDNRNDEYCQSLIEIFNDENVSKHSRILGFLDRDEQLVVMKYSKFIIQPSLFEGWGTVLEDAKVLDKLVILSNIKVHREQKNSNCFLFEPNDYKELADLILKVLQVEHADDIQKGIKNMYDSARKYSDEFLKLLQEN